MDGAARPRNVNHLLRLTAVPLPITCRRRLRESLLHPAAPMIPIFESILPIFLIVLLGAALRRATVHRPERLARARNLGYYVLFPALLFLTLATGDFPALNLEPSPSFRCSQWP
jgi:hypothetical protein